MRVRVRVLIVRSSSSSSFTLLLFPAQRSNQFKRIGQQEEQAKAQLRANFKAKPSSGWKAKLQQPPCHSSTPVEQRKPLPGLPSRCQSCPCFNCDYNYAVHWLLFPATFYLGSNLVQGFQTFLFPVSLDWTPFEVRFSVFNRFVAKNKATQCTFAP